MYYFHIDPNIVLPIAPKSITLEYPNRNETVDLASGFEFNRRNPVGLKSISFSFLLPSNIDAVSYALKSIIFITGSAMLEEFTNIKEKGRIFRFAIIRRAPNGSPNNQSTIIPYATIEDLKVNEDAAETGMGYSVDISIKEYVFTDNSTVDARLENSNSQKTRPTEVMTGSRSYTVKAGDTGQSIARAMYGDSAAWSAIYAANKDLIDERAAKDGQPKGYLAIGMVLTIPPYSRAQTTPNATTAEADPLAYLKNPNPLRVTESASPAAPAVKTPDPYSLRGFLNVDQTTYSTKSWQSMMNAAERPSPFKVFSNE